MGMTFTTDTRPTVLGNLVLITGTYDDDGTRSGSILLSDHFSKLLHVGVASHGDSSATAYIHSAGSPLQMTISCGANGTGNWMALGIRG
jgi:hypothetical protein